MYCHKSTRIIEATNERLVIVFEYLIASYDPEKIVLHIKNKPETYKADTYRAIQLEQLSEDGWELINAAPVDVFRSTYTLHLFFKRKKG